MLPTDGLAVAQAASERFAEARAVHYWDGDRHLARRLARALGIPARASLGVEGDVGLAWDVYLAYGRGAGDLDRPAFWMHQLGVGHAPRLDAAEFRRRVEGLLQGGRSVGG